MSRKPVVRYLLPLYIVGCLLGTSAAAQTYDLIIRGGTIYDGSGAPPWTGDVAVDKGKIVAVEPRVPGTAGRIVNAHGLAVSPGFIDPHTHDMQSIQTVHGPFLDEQDLAQGITTVILGPDGQESPKSLAVLISAAQHQGTSQNYGCYVGHNGIRKEVIGHAHRDATAAEMEQMKAQVRQGMTMGCVGLSAGLMYDPGMFSPPQEIIDLAKEVQPFDGIYDSHSRNPVTDFMGSELETAHIGIAAGIPAKLGHIKAVGLTNKGKSTELIDAVNALRAQGHEIVGDVYPYDGAATLDLQDLIIFPDQATAHGLSDDQKQARIKAALANPAAKAALKEASEQGVNNGFSWIKVGAYTASRIVVAPGQPELVGQFISVLAEEHHEDPFDVLTGILANAKGPIIVVIGTIDEQDMRNFLVQPWDMISSDSAYIGLSIPAHPRSTGAFVRVLGHYVRDVKLLSLQEAIRKMTSLPADFLRLYDRGRLAPGKVADIAIFDARRVADLSDYEHPKRLAQGVVEVFVNGTSVWRDNKPTGATPGVFVRRQQKPMTRPALKIYVSVDMEGVAGVVSGDQLNPPGFEYERFRGFMTDEALAAVHAATDAGATEVVVSDSHGNGENLLIERFPKDVKLVRSFPRHGAMMAGLDASFAAAVFIGYHASTTNPAGVRAHTISSAHFTRVALNGVPVTEAEFNAAYAGDLGVPVVFVSGDDVAVAEITGRLGPLDAVVTKESLGFEAAETLTPTAACDAIYQGVRAAIGHREQRKPLKISHPITVELSLKNYRAAEVLTYLRTIERADAHSVRFVGRDMREVSDFVDFVDSYNPDLTP